MLFKGSEEQKDVRRTEKMEKQPFWKQQQSMLQLSRNWIIFW